MRNFTKQVSANSHDGAADLSPGRRRGILAVVAVALMMVVSAVSGLNVALPDLARDTGASQTEMTWIVDAYTVVFAGMLLGAGALGDRYGRKRMLIIGLVIFGTAAGWAMTVGDPAVLIVIRAVMGIGAAAVMPTTLAVITTSFPEAERGKAIGLWVGVAGGGAVLGLFASGILLEYFAWNSFFALNVALAGTALLGTLALIPESRSPGQGRFDTVGAVLSVVAVSSLVFAIIEGTDQGWSEPLTLLSAGTAVLSLAGFVARELTTASPLLDVRLFRSRGFSAGSVSITLQFFASFGFFFIIMQYLQFVTGRSPLEAAVTVLPMPFLLIPTARLAPRLADRIGINITGALGLGSIAVGLGIISTLTASFDAVIFYSGLAFFAIGMGLAGTPATTAITRSLPPERQGVASAVNDVSREFGSALGIAVLGSLLSSTYRDAIAPALEGLPTGVADGASSSIAFVQADAVEGLGPAAQPLIDAATSAFADGVSTATLTGAGVVLAGAVFVLLRAPRRQSTPRS